MATQATQGDSSIHGNRSIQGNGKELSWQQKHSCQHEQCRATVAFIATQAMHGDSRIHGNRSIQSHRKELSWQHEQCMATAAFLARGAFKAIGRSFHGSRSNAW
jgi:hypothetical protein